MNYFKYIAFIAFFASIVSNVLADQNCKRYNRDNSIYKEIIEDPNYIFFDGKTTCKMLDAFLDKLATGLKNDDTNQIAELIHYPCNWNTTNRKRIVIKNKAQFQKLYKKIFTDKVKKIAIEAQISEVGYRGFMIDRGIIWFFPSTGIMCINQPDE